MTAEEAVKNIETHICRWCTVDEHCEDCEIFMGEEALEKQIPQKIIFEPTGKQGGYYYCPACHDEIGFEDACGSRPFCANCGQALDWEEKKK